MGGGEQHGEFLDMIPNAPIGLWPGLEYEGEEIDSIKGRPLFIYTDGLETHRNGAEPNDDLTMMCLRV